MTTETQMGVVELDGLHSFAEHVLQDVGVPEADARTVADTMVWADMRGQHSHGVWYLSRYVEGLRGGGVNARANISIVRETPATAVVDGDNGLGGLVAVRAAQIAARMAARAGCATVVVRNSNHFGAASFYSLLLAEHGCIGIITSNTGAAMAPPNGKARLLGTQPISYAVADPDGDGPVMLDMALSVVAGTKVTQAKADGQSIPEGWIVDADGNPTTDPADLFQGGALLPVGGHKGYGLAILTEILAGVLSGAAMTTEVKSHHPSEASGTGHCIIALNVESFMPVEEFRARLAKLRTQVHATPVRDGAQPPMLPGEPEFQHRLAAERDGIGIEPVIWKNLAELADAFNRRDELMAARR